MLVELRERVEDEAAVEGLRRVCVGDELARERLTRHGSVRSPAFALRYSARCANLRTYPCVRPSRPDPDANVRRRCGSGGSTSSPSRYRHAAGPFAMSGGRVSTEQDSTVVRLETDDGLVGYGESCVISPDYAPGYAGSTRAVLGLLAPAMLGLDPRQLGPRVRANGRRREGIQLREVGARHGLLGSLRAGDRDAGQRPARRHLPGGVPALHGRRDRRRRRRCAAAVVDARRGRLRPDPDQGRERAGARTSSGSGAAPRRSPEWRR